MDWMHAADSHGIANLTELRDAGLGRPDVTRLTREGALTRLARGWYAVGPVHNDVDRHVLATRAALRSHEGRAVAGSYSALLVLRLPTLDAELTSVRLTRRTPGPTSTTATLRLGRCVPARFQLAETVTPAMAVVQYGTSSGPMAALVAADGALRTGVSTRTDLDDALDVVHGHPHTDGLAALLRHADGRHESPGETRLAEALRRLGISATPQVRISTGGFTAVVDFLVDDAPVVIEFDGRVKYGRTVDDVDPFGRRSPGQQVLWEEKRREDRLRDLGYQVVRVIWSDLDTPRELADRIRRAIARARSHGT